MLRKSFCAGVLTLSLLIPALAADFTLSPAIKASAAAKTQADLRRLLPRSRAFGGRADAQRASSWPARSSESNAIFAGPVGGGAEKQVAELENWITKGVDGLAVSSSSTDALAPVINKALAAGIPVVTFNTDNPASKRLTFVGQDLVYSGAVMGDTLVKAMGDKGKILSSRSTRRPNGRKIAKRARAMRSPSIPASLSQRLINTTNEPQQIYAAIENAMLANPDMTGHHLARLLQLPSDRPVYSSATNWLAKSRSSAPTFLPQTRELILSGALTATITQNPQRQGHDSVLVLNEIYASGKMPPSHTDTGVEVIDKSNVEQHQAE